MSSAQLLVSDIVALLLLLCLVGLCVRRRLAAVPCFAIYLGLVLASDRMITWWPATFYTRPFFYWKESTLGLLTIAIILDLAAIAFASWPRARRIARFALAIIGVATAVLPFLLLSREGTSEPALGALAWVQAGTAWGFVVLLEVAHWYRLPLHGLHRSMVIGFVLYLALYATALGLSRHWPGHAMLLALDSLVYTASLGIWTVAAWRPEPSLAPASERRLIYPWLRP